MLCWCRYINCAITLSIEYIVYPKSYYDLNLIIKVTKNIILNQMSYI